MKKIHEEEFIGAVVTLGIAGFLVLSILSMASCNQVGDLVEATDKAAPVPIFSVQGRPPTIAEVFADKTVKIAKGHTCQESLDAAVLQSMTQKEFPPSLREELAKGIVGARACEDTLRAMAAALVAAQNPPEKVIEKIQDLPPEALKAMAEAKAAPAKEPEK